MNSVGLHVFAQLLKVLPMDTFEAIAAKYPLKPCNSRKFTPRDYFTAMLFGQLSGASPLREVVLGMAIAGEKIVHTGAKFMKRTTLAYNNNHSNPLIFKDFYFAVLEQFRCELGHKKQAQFDKPLFSIDSSTISLGCKLYGWANFRRHKKGIKVHTGLSNELGLPEVVVMTVAKKADVRCAEAVIEQLPQEAIIVMDRGYNDYRLFNWIDKRNTVFVTRLKRTLLIHRSMKAPWSEKATTGPTITLPLPARPPRKSAAKRSGGWFGTSIRSKIVGLNSLRMISTALLKRLQSFTARDGRWSSS